MRRTKAATMAVFAVVTVALGGVSAAASAPASTSENRKPGVARSTQAEVVVYFTRGEHFAKVARPSDGAPRLDSAMQALFAGLTEAERARGLRTHIPAQAALLGTSASGSTAIVDVSTEFTRGPRVSLRARLAQVVYTATGVPGIEDVRMTVAGAALEELGGLALEPPIGRDEFAPVPQGGPPLAPVPQRRSALVLTVQKRLIELGYLPAGAADGIAGPQTEQAILGFQGWEGLRRDGRATHSLRTALQAASRPVAPRGASRRIDVSLRRQVALLVEGGRTVRAIHVSTGKPSTPTPPGRFAVFRKELRSWSVPFQVWLPYASYFNRGIAFHESPSVPAYPASAGCVRVAASDSALVYSFATLGTRVIVRRS